MTEEDISSQVSSISSDSTSESSDTTSEMSSKASNQEENKLENNGTPTQKITPKEETKSSFGDKSNSRTSTSSKIQSNVTSNLQIQESSTQSTHGLNNNEKRLTNIPVHDLVTVFQLSTVSLYIDSTMIAYISLNNRNSPVNLMNQEFVRDLNECLDWLESGILLTEEGRKSEVIDTNASMIDQLKQYKEFQKKRKNAGKESTTGIIIDNRYKKIQCVVIVSEKDTFMVGADIFGLYQISDAKRKYENLIF